MINELSEKIHQANVKKGSYEDEKNIGEMLALVHSEVSEALEAHRKGMECTYNPNTALSFSDDEFEHRFKVSIKDTFEDEIADSIMRLLDLAAFKGIDIEAHIKAKMRYNAMRPYKHGKKY